MSGITAVAMAGSRLGGDPFAEKHGTDLKPLIPVAGEPMVQWPVAALLACNTVGRVLVLTQQPERIGAVLPADPRLTVARSGATIASTVLDLIDNPATEWPLLVTTADHALLTPTMVQEFVAHASGADLGIGVVERAALLERLPQSKRTWIPFRGGAYTGANLFLLGSRKARPAVELWRSVEQDRKKGWRLLAALGPAVLLGALFRLRTLDQTVAALGRRLGLSIRAVQLSDPLAAVDVDKEEDLALAEAILAFEPDAMPDRLHSKPSDELKRTMIDSNYRFLAWAIENHQPLFGIYDGKPREFCPVTLGQKNENKMARVWQTGGESSRPLPAWTTLRVAKLRDLEIRSGDWKPEQGEGERGPGFEVDYDSNENSPYGPTKSLGDLRGRQLSSVLQLP